MGRGYWNVIDIDYDAIKNTTLLITQDLAYREEGKFIFSDIRAGIGMTRHVILEWTKPDLEMEPFIFYNEVHVYGEQRVVKQTFMQIRDEWSIDGDIKYGWYPPV